MYLYYKYNACHDISFALALAAALLVAVTSIPDPYLNVETWSAIVPDCNGTLFDNCTKCAKGFYANTSELMVITMIIILINCVELDM